LGNSESSISFLDLHKSSSKLTSLQYLGGFQQENSTSGPKETFLAVLIVRVSSQKGFGQLRILNFVFGPAQIKFIQADQLIIFGWISAREFDRRSMGNGNARKLLNLSQILTVLPGRIWATMKTQALISRIHFSNYGKSIHRVMFFIDPPLRSMCNAYYLVRVKRSSTNCHI
jgi:hypothetical protein